MSASIGMMEGAYFVGRVALLEWINELTGLGLTKIEQTSNGVVGCHVFDALFPGTLRMDKVKFDAKSDYETLQNYKVLQEAFSRTGINKNIPVTLLTKGKYQDNLEFMQWVKGYFDQYAGEEALSYDGRAVREELGFVGKTSRSRPTANKSRLASKAGNTVRKTSAARAPLAARSTASSRARANATHKTTRAAAQPARAKRAVPQKRTESEVETLRDEIAQLDQHLMDADKERAGLKDEIAQLDALLQEGDNERAFFYNKLQDIESVLQDLDRQYHDSELDDLTRDLVTTIRRVLYEEGESGGTIARPGSKRESEEGVENVGDVPPEDVVDAEESQLSNVASPAQAE